MNGEIYTSRYDKGWIGRYDPETGEYNPSFLQMYRASLDLYVVIHPTGNYMYIMVRNRHTIIGRIITGKQKHLGLLI